MENRGQKRPEVPEESPIDKVEESPAEKRACSSAEYTPSSPSSTNQSQTSSISVNFDPETQTDEVATTSSSTPASNQGEEQPDKDLTESEPYSDSDNDSYDEQPIYAELDSVREHQRTRSVGDQEKFGRIILRLSEESDQSAQLAALTELCEVLSFCTDISMSKLMPDSLSPILVKLANCETNPDIMILAIRALTYMCDVHPTSSVYLVRHNALPVLCQRLISINYLDVAEQCLQALDKISRYQPQACLQSGAVMAVLSFLDFFPTSIQRTAVCTVVNICKKLPSKGASQIMEAIPILCNILQYEDTQLVENVATCFIQIVGKVGKSPEMLEQLCSHELILQATRLIDLSCRITISQPIYAGLLGMLVKLAASSVTAVKTLFELNISSIAMEILSSNELTHGISSSHMADVRYNQVHVVLKLLNELLPTIARGDQHVQPASDKESFIVNQPDLLRKFGINVLPKLIQVVESGTNLYVCYWCLSIINKIVYFSKADMLHEPLKNINISSFLASVLIRKDHHILILTLEITESFLQKLPDYFLNSFNKEGILFTVNALITPKKCSQTMPSDLSPNSNTKPRCLCYASDTKCLEDCELEHESVQSLAKRISTKYFTGHSHNPENGLTGIFHKLKIFSDALIDVLDVSTEDASAEHEEILYHIMNQIVDLLMGSEPVSTFEFIQSGVVKSMAAYVSGGLHKREIEEKHNGVSHFNILEKRFQGFARQLLSSSDPTSEDMPLSVIIRKLLSALSSVENFPVISSQVSQNQNSYCVVPSRRNTTYTCFSVRFVREEGDTSLSDYRDDVLTVDPLSSMDAIVEFLWPKVTSKRKGECVKSSDKCNKSLTPEVNSEGNDPQPSETDVITSALHRKLQVAGLPSSPSEPAADLRETNIEEKHEGDVSKVSVKPDLQCSSEADIEMKAQTPTSSSVKDDSPKLSLHLNGHQLDQAMTLYQSVLTQELERDSDLLDGEKLWTQVYTITYKRTSDTKERHLQHGCESSQDSSVSEKVGMLQFAPFFSRMFDSGYASGLDKSSATYNVLFLIKILELMNKFAPHLMSHQRISAFAEGKLENLDDLKVSVSAFPQKEFVSNKLTDKLEQQMCDPLSLSIGGLPSWCNNLVTSYPFLFDFEARSKYFRLSVFGPLQGQPNQSSPGSSKSSVERGRNAGGLPRKKVLVSRDRILASASKMMGMHARGKVVLEVEYEEEVGTGLGPTLEFYTLVSLEFQNPGLRMWREYNDDHGGVVSRFGLFPRPWSSTLSESNDILFCDVINKFVLLGQVVAKALQDGRVLDVPLSKSFYKLIRRQELNLYDIQTFDPELGRTLIEFKATVDKKIILDCSSSTMEIDSCFRGTRIEDLHLDFTLPGYPDYTLTSGSDYNMVHMSNLEEYVSLIVDATIHTGILRQVEAFRFGFDEVFPIKHLQIFTEEEIERLLCGEQDSWNSHEFLDHVKFDHGYTANSPPVLNLLEIVHEFDFNQRRAFLQFVTGAPRLPRGGLASLKPKLTVVCKHCSQSVDAELPSVMTCANYLKMPPYSSKETMKQKLLYAITEGQGSFHLS